MKRSDGRARKFLGHHTRANPKIRELIYGVCHKWPGKVAFRNTGFQAQATNAALMRQKNRCGIFIRNFRDTTLDNLESYWYQTVNTGG